MAMSEHSVLGLSPAGFHRIVYSSWGRRDGGRAVLCLHGLTRNGRDFDWLASTLSARHAVVCPDMAGRGRSDWLPNPALYNFAQYLADANTVIARLGVGSVDVVGTSMGGILGMMLAAQPHSPVRRLVVNDVGPVIAREGLERLADYVGKEAVFEDLAGIESYLRFVLMAFGPLSDRQWRHLAENSVRRLPDGRLALAYDPAIAASLRGGPVASLDLWPAWDAIRCPTLVLRGGVSDILTAATAEEMTRRGPNARLVTVPGIGHAPPLIDEAQTAIVAGFLDEP